MVEPKGLSGSPFSQTKYLTYQEYNFFKLLLLLEFLLKIFYLAVLKMWLNFKYFQFLHVSPSLRFPCLPSIVFVCCSVYVVIVGNFINLMETK